jgi:hypothetical protein
VAETGRSSLGEPARPPGSSRIESRATEYGDRTGHRTALPRPAPVVTPWPRPLVAEGRPREPGSLVLSVIWVVLTGFRPTLSYLIAGVVQCSLHQTHLVTGSCSASPLLASPLGLANFKIIGMSLLSANARPNPTAAW